jgi:hypothetical protein
MCIQSNDQNSTAGRLRRKAVVAAGSSAALAGVPALSFTHGHPITGAIFIAMQFCLITIAMGFLVQMKRLKASS